MGDSGRHKWRRYGEMIGTEKDLVDSTRTQTSTGLSDCS